MQNIPASCQRKISPVAKRGQVIVLICLALVTIMGLIGLVTDVGYWQAQKQLMQTAADSAALAAAQELNYGDSVAAGLADAAGNGFTNGQNGIVVAVNNPPLSGPNAGKSGYLEAIVSRPEPTFFLRAIGVSTINLSARAVSAVGNNPNCIYVMDPAASGAMTLSGSVSIQSGCGLLVDSSSSSAISTTSGVTVTAPHIGVVGGSSGGGTFTPQPQTGVVPAPDPLAYVQAPSYGSCNQSSFSLSGTNGTAGSPYQMWPGVYCGGITLHGNSYLHFNSGTYVLAGGGFSAGGTSTMMGTGVTFYNTTGAGGYQGLALAGNVTMNFSAPTSGPLAGIMFFQDRSIPTSAAGSTIAGNSGTTIDGAFYFPTTTLTYTGNSSSSGYSIIVADKLIANGNSQLRNNYTSLANGSPIKTPVLSE